MNLARLDLESLSLRIRERNKIALREAEISMLSAAVRLPALAVTITFKPSVAGKHLTQNYDNAENAIGWFLELLDTRCFKHSHRRFNFNVGSTVVIEGLGNWERMHCHLSLEKPINMDINQFKQIIRDVARKVHFLGRIKIVPIRDYGWHLYMTKDKNREVLWSLCRKANP